MCIIRHAKLGQRVNSNKIFVFFAQAKCIFNFSKFLITHHPVAGQAGYEICGIQNQYIKYVTVKIGGRLFILTSYRNVKV